MRATPRITRLDQEDSIHCALAGHNRRNFWWEPMLRLRDLGFTPDPRSARVTGVNEKNSAALDISEVPAIEVVLTVSVHLLSAAAVACGLAEDGDGSDLAEARILINALAGLITASAPDLGAIHAAPLRDGLQSLQRAFREASPTPDPPGAGPGEALTGPVY